MGIRHIIFDWKWRFRKFVGRFRKWWTDFLLKSPHRRDKLATGLVECFASRPYTRKELDAKHFQALLQKLGPNDRAKMIKHFTKLSKETDPSADDREISDDSVKKVGMDISTEDVQARIQTVSETATKQRANDLIRGQGRWPVPPSDPTKRRH